MALPSKATTVTGTGLADVNGNLCSGTVSAFLAFPAGVTPLSTFNGLPINPASGAFPITNGNFSIILADNNSGILPTGTKWQFTLVCNAINIGPYTPTNSAQVVVNVTPILIGGGSQDISGSITIPPLGPGGGSFNGSGAPINIIAKGAKCDGTTDDTTAINTAYALLTGQNQGQIVWPSNRVCVLSGTVSLTNAQSVSITGGSVLWKGNASTPIFQYITDREVVTTGFYITTASTGSFPMGTAFDIRENITSPQLTSSGNIFINNVIEGRQAGGLNIGFRQANGTFSPATNDEMQYYGNEVRSYTTAGFQIDDSQATDDVFIGNRCYANLVGAECVLDTAGAGFSWKGGFTGQNTNADFNICSQTQHPITIDSIASEGSNRFVLTCGPTGSAMPINLINDRVSTNGINVDGRVVQYNGPGPLNVVGGSYGQGNTPPTFFFAPNTGSTTTIFGSFIGVSFSGNNSRATNPLAFFPSTLTVNVAMANNSYQDGSGVSSAPTTPEVFSLAGPLTIRANVFSKLAACGATTEGQTAAVTDSTTATWGATVTGGSTNHIIAYCDGTNWTVSAK